MSGAFRRRAFSAALGTYLLSGPVWHFVNDAPLRGLGSFGLPVGAPVVGASVGAMAGFVLTAAKGND